MKIKNMIVFFVLYAFICESFTQQAESTLKSDKEKFEMVLQQGHYMNPNPLAFSKDGKYLISSSEYDYCVIIWDFASGKAIRTFQTGIETAIKSSAISPDNKYILAGLHDYTLKLWESSSGKEVKTFIGHKAIVSYVEFSPDGKNILSVSEDKKIKIWEVESGREIRSFEGQAYNILKASFLPDGKSFIAGLNDNTIKIMDIATGSEIKSIQGIKAAAFSKDFKFALSGWYYDPLKICDIETGKDVTDIKKDFYYQMNCSSFSPDGKYLLVGVASRENNFSLFNTQNGEKIKSFSGHPEFVVACAFSPDGKYAASSSWGTIKIWDVESGILVKTLRGRSVAIIGSAVSSDERYIATGADDHTAKIWDVTTGKLIKTFIGHNKGVTSVDFSNDGKLLITASGYENIIKIWNISTGEEVKTFTAESEWKPLKAIFSPDDKNILISGYDATFRLFKIIDGKEIRSFKGQNLPGATFTTITSMAFSPDGKSILISSQGGGIKLWDIASGNEVKKITGHTNFVESAVFSPDGKNILSSSDDCSVKLWDCVTGQNIKTFNGHKNFVYTAVFSKDGKYIFSGSADSTIKMWDTESGSFLKTFSGHTSIVTCISVIAGGNYIVSSSWDRTVKIWNVQTGECTASLISNYDGSEWLCYTPDGYWDGSSKGGDFIAMAKEMNVWNIDQFAAKYNRPDIIIERLGSNDKDLIKHFNQQYKKRLRKLGLTEEQLSSELYVPESAITGYRQDGKIMTVDFVLSDGKYNLKRYNIYVNDVPLFGSYGKEISGSTLSLSENIDLIGGMNKIEVSCMNEKGSESYRAAVYAEYKEQTAGDLYFLAFGVSQYKDASLNLKYADKDAIDLSKAIQKLNKSQFKNVIVKTYTNGESTVKNIKTAKDFLKTSKADDTFILFIAGHGVHDTDKEATYYYITHETDLRDLPHTAANFDLIEDILQGIPPRNKLFLMDTCESGEIEDGIQKTYYASAGSRGLKSRGIKVTEIKSSKSSVKKIKRSYLYEQDRYIYNDLARRSGAIVFSSSKGGELSYEKDDIQNGLFTESIIKCLSSKEADKDNNGTISTDELRDYVTKAVASSSGDLQHPTVDRDNIYQKFGFGIVK